LDNNSQTVFLHLLETTDLGEALKRFQGKYEDARKVVTQIVARQLDSMPSKRASTDGAIVMHLYLTNQCNMRCPHCYMLAGCKMENELKTEEIKVIMSNFKNYGGSLVTLSGGEVSLRDDLIEICQYSYSINLPLEILTNGLKWTDDMIRIIAPTLYRIQVSIDGYDESENKKIRGAGAFEKALSTVDRFVKANIRTDVAITPVFSDDLHNHIDDYLTFALSLEEKYKNGRFKIQFNGEIMDGDCIMAILGMNMKREGKLQKDTIVATVMSNLGMTKFSEQNSINLRRTDVGDRYVLEDMLANGYNLGGEQSGHVILLDYNPTGDGILTSLMLIKALIDSKQKASEIRKIIKVYPQVLINAKVSSEKKYDFNKDEEINKKIAKLEEEFSGNGRVLIRASGTEPKVRVMIEGDNQEYITKKAQELAIFIEKRLN
jgi:sulfatase maturation enzyme AslB (radical SAM superfamily)